MKTFEPHFVIRFDLEAEPDLDPTAGTYNADCGAEVHLSEATRYATREIAELHNRTLSGGTVVEDPSTAPYWRFIELLRNAPEETLPVEVEGWFRALFQEPRVVTEGPK